MDIATKEIDDKLCLMTESDNGSVDEDKDLESIIGCALDIFVKTLQGEDD